MDSYEQFTDGYVLLRAVYDTLRILYELFMDISIRIDNRKKIFDMSKICLTFYGCLRVLPSCYELFTDTNELFTNACG